MKANINKQQKSCRGRKYFVSSIFYCRPQDLLKQVRIYCNTVCFRGSRYAAFYQITPLIAVQFLIVFSIYNLSSCSFGGDLEAWRKRAYGDVDPAITVFVPVEMVWIPGGNFELGKDLGTAATSDVTPVSEVTLTGFHMGKYQVTQEQYQAVMGTNPSHFGGNPASEEVQGRRPVESVSTENKEQKEKTHPTGIASANHYQAIYGKYRKR